MNRPFLFGKLICSLLPIPLTFSQLVHYRAALHDPETGAIVYEDRAFSIFQNLVDGGYGWLAALSLFALAASAFLALSSLLWSKDRKVGVIGTVCWGLSLAIFVFAAAVGFSVGRGF